MPYRGCLGHQLLGHALLIESRLTGFCLAALAATSSVVSIMV
jgi:hypothetical protein